MEPITPLPAGVPELPPGMFYRVTRENLSAFPVYWLTIREQGRWFSRAVSTDIRVRADADTDPETALRQACRAAVDGLVVRRQECAVWARIDGYVGDHHAGEVS